MLYSYWAWPTKGRRDSLDRSNRILQREHCWRRSQHQTPRPTTKLSPRRHQFKVQRSPQRKYLRRTTKKNLVMVVKTMKRTKNTRISTSWYIQASGTRRSTTPSYRLIRRNVTSNLQAPIVRRKLSPKRRKLTLRKGCKWRNCNPFNKPASSKRARSSNLNLTKRQNCHYSKLKLNHRQILDRISSFRL